MFGTLHSSYDLDKKDFSEKSSQGFLACQSISLGD